MHTYAGQQFDMAAGIGRQHVFCEFRFCSSKLSSPDLSSHEWIVIDDRDACMDTCGSRSGDPGRPRAHYQYVGCHVIHR
jgi:hypothetical protein